MKLLRGARLRASRRPLTTFARDPAAALKVRAAILESLQNIVLFPQVGRPQQTEGVRKFVTRKCAYLIYYMIDDAADEIVILSVKHPAQEREHGDA
jgi:plasmid stabilization system protein ParE